MLKKLLFFLSVILISTISYADDYVKGYYRSDGTYVGGYYRSSPNGSVTDNYTYKGNTNPYTGTQGSDYYRNSPSSQYYGTSGTTTPVYTYDPSDN